MSDDWLSDIKGTEGDSDDSDHGSGSTLFEDNFRQMVESGDVDALNPQTIKNQIDQIDDRELLSAAVDEDDRDELIEVYEDRVAAINQAEQEEPGNSTEEDSAGDSSSSPSSSPSTSDSDDDSDETDDTTGDEEIEEETVDQVLEQVEDGDETGETESVGGGDADEATEEAEAEADSPTDSDVSEEAVEAEEETSEEPEAQTTDSVEETQVTDATDDSDLPEVDVSSLAPSATSREEAVEKEDRHTMLVWGLEGTGKSHVAHTAPAPIAYIDTEGKADDIAGKFDKEVYYFQPSNYSEAVDALDQSLDLLAAYREQGVTGTIVVDSMTKMWDWAKQDYVELAYPSADGPDDVDFKSALQGEDDWKQIKRRHNQNFRDRIIESPYHVVFTAMAKEDYNAVLKDGASGKPMTDDGEKQNRYVVKDVVRLRTADDGRTVADLHKAARTRYSFMGLEWPEWNDIYGAIDKLVDAENSEGQTDVTQWSFDVVDGQPVGTTDGSDEDDE